MTWIPIAIGVKPAIIERGPFDAHLLQLRHRAQHLLKTSADAFRVAIARVIAAQLAEVGIAVEVRSFEFATFFADVKKGVSIAFSGKGTSGRRE